MEVDMNEQRFTPAPAAQSDEREALTRYRFLMALLIDHGVLTNSRYPNGVWSLQGIYGIDDSGLRGAGRTAEEAIDNAIAAAKLDPADKLTHWRATHETLKRNADAEEGTLGFAALATQSPTLTTCNCRWDGEVQVQSCTLHEAWKETIHEYAERLRAAQPPAPQAKVPEYWETYPDGIFSDPEPASLLGEFLAEAKKAGVTNLAPLDMEEAAAPDVGGDRLIELAEKCSAEVGRYEGQVLWVKFHSLASVECFAARVVMRAAIARALPQGAPDA
jgi:hypothetical protein